MSGGDATEMQALWRVAASRHGGTVSDDDGHPTLNLVWNDCPITLTQVHSARREFRDEKRLVLVAHFHFPRPFGFVAVPMPDTGAGMTVRLGAARVEISASFDSMVLVEGTHRRQVQWLFSNTKLQADMVRSPFERITIENPFERMQGQTATGRALVIEARSMPKSAASDIDAIIEVAQQLLTRFDALAQQRDDDGDDDSDGAQTEILEAAKAAHHAKFEWLAAVAERQADMVMVGLTDASVGRELLAEIRLKVFDVERKTLSAQFVGDWPHGEGAFILRTKASLFDELYNLVDVKLGNEALDAAFLINADAAVVPLLREFAPSLERLVLQRKQTWGMPPVSEMTVSGEEDGLVATVQNVSLDALLPVADTWVALWRAFVRHQLGAV